MFLCFKTYLQHHKNYFHLNDVKEHISVLKIKHTIVGLKHEVTLRVVYAASLFPYFGEFTIERVISL